MNKKNKQLGMPIGTAANKLRKTIIYSLAKRLNEHYCYQCGAEIESVNELSIEHKVPYLNSDDPIKLFFDLDNIAFSHLDCNIAASRRNRGGRTHGKYATYRNGCRCDECKYANKIRVRKQRQSLIAQLQSN